MISPHPSDRAVFSSLCAKLRWWISQFEIKLWLESPIGLASKEKTLSKSSFSVKHRSNRRQ
ncbi:hypothetical protein EYF80_034630 [Liparis tanakae]|uniref:Uncharacterized protein n=1 Tax=Liparis tanakae TaxID=230148 RepID=A0A4Z2GPZ8_9TELE|nr:hypothetical protein EYF80_034630 [Liparis tanakae]